MLINYIIFFSKHLQNLQSLSLIVMEIYNFILHKKNLGNQEQILLGVNKVLLWCNV